MKYQCINVNGRNEQVLSVNPIEILDNYGDNPFWNHWLVKIQTVNHVVMGTVEGDDNADEWAWETFEIEED